MNLTPQFMFTILKRHENFKELTKVISVKLESCIADNHNFLSHIQRATVRAILNDNKQKIINIIVKSGEHGMIKGGMKTDASYFQSDVKVYVFFNRLLNWVHSKGFNVEKLWADCYYSVTDRSPFYILLQDLTDFGFSITLNPQGRHLLDEDHAFLAVENLAKIHAMSRCYMSEEIPDISFKDPHFDFFKQFFKIGLTALAKAVPKYKDNWHYIADYLIDLSEHAHEEFMKDLYRVKNHFTVLSLGDCWTNNFLFKYLNKKPINIRFIDFQFAHYNSLVWDLNFLLFTSLLPKSRLDNMDALLRLYIDSFEKTIVSINKDVSLSPSYEQVIELLNKISLSSFLLSSVIAVELYSANDDDFKEINGLSDDNHIKTEWYLRDPVANGYIQNIEYFESMGLFKK